MNPIETKVIEIEKDIAILHTTQNHHADAIGKNAGYFEEIRAKTAKIELTIEGWNKYFKGGFITFCVCSSMIFSMVGAAMLQVYATNESQEKTLGNIDYRVQTLEHFMKHHP